MSEKFSNRLFSTVDKIYSNIIPSDIVATVIQEIPLSASNFNKKTKEYKIHTVSIPYSGAAVSLGRKIIQNLCGVKRHLQKCSSLSCTMNIIFIIHSV